MRNDWMREADSFKILDARDAEPGGFLPMIMTYADTLPEGEGIHVIQSFEPVPLYAVMEGKGFVHETDSVQADEYHVFFYRTPIAPLQDASMSTKMKTHLEVDADRIAAIQRIVEDFYGGVALDKLKARFDDELQTISGSEFAFVEQTMTERGVGDDQFKTHVEELISIFKESLAQHEAVGRESGHPLDTFRRENLAIVDLVDELRAAAETAIADSIDTAWWTQALDRLWEINLHYLRKENQLFPRLEQKGFDKPSTVMWQIHDDIRAGIKTARSDLARGDGTAMLTALPPVLDAVVDMTFKEEKILFPTSEAMLTDADWQDVRRGEEEIGYCLIEPPPS